MKIMIGANLLNVGGNALLIYALDMEVAGAAWATLISRILSAVLVIAFLVKARIPFMQDARLHSLSSAFSTEYRGSVGKILKVGMPYSFENGMFYLGRVLVLAMVAAAGTSALAANSVAGTIILFQVLPGMAIVAGMPVVIAHCVGAGDYVQARFYNKKILGYTYLCLLASCVLVVAALPLTLRIYGLPEQTSAWIREIVWRPAGTNLGMDTGNRLAPRPLHGLVLAAVLCAANHIPRRRGCTVPDVDQHLVDDFLPPAVFLPFRYRA